MTNISHPTSGLMVRVQANALAQLALAPTLWSLAAAALLLAHARPAAAQETGTSAPAEPPSAAEPAGPMSAPQAAPTPAAPAPASSAATTKPEQPEEDPFVHPFFAHMSLADPVGTASFRFTGIRYKSDLETGNDFGLHIEAGILPGLGIHIRSDSIKREPFSEVMLMYNLFTTADGAFGVSVFGQVSIPTGAEAGRTYKGLFGGAVMFALGHIVVFNGNIHYDPKNTMAEWEGAFVFRASKFLYPVLEVRGELTSNSSDDTAYVLLGTQFRIRPSQTIGAGFQIAMTTAREYNDEALLQYGTEF